jgi:hypothetical protein
MPKDFPTPQTNLYAFLNLKSKFRKQREVLAFKKLLKSFLNLRKISLKNIKYMFDVLFGKRQHSYSTVLQTKGNVA